MKSRTIFPAMFPILAAALLASATLLPAAPAHAGVVSNAELACFGDTDAYDYSTVGYCESAWMPSTATHPTTEVTVRDTDTNATKTLNAYAYFWDGWN